MLFHQTSAEPGAADVNVVRALLEKAVLAERDYGRPEIVAEAYRSAIIAAQRVLGPDHHVTLQARHRLAHWTGNTGDFAAAAYLFQRLWEDQRRVLSPDHPELARTETAVAYWPRRR